MKTRLLVLAVISAIAPFVSATAQAAAVSLSDVTWAPTGAAGITTGGSTVPESATGNTQFGYVTTFGGVAGVSPLVLRDEGAGSENQTNGTKIVSSVFSANQNDTLNLQFNYVSTDGRGFDDYAWARLVSAGNQTAAWLFTARSTNSAQGNVVPGNILKRQTNNDLPDELDAVLNNGDTIGFDVSSTLWSPLGISSGICWDSANTCGPTGWINSDFTFTAAGSYSLEFGVMNWGDEAYDSALAFDFGGLRLANFSDVTVVDNAAPIPEPETWAMMMAGLGLMGFMGRRRKSKQA